MPKRGEASGRWAGPILLLLILALAVMAAQGKVSWVFVGLMALGYYAVWTL